ncbi:hypothetical protein WJX74_010537 [Apatococcus lobatus]|uniref:Protein kinase domain-containing protein n=1 Tax=Apatococcus lobatus TaxID=904363 RepID=A0AAW1QVM8_9CHLO
MRACPSAQRAKRSRHAHSAGGDTANAGSETLTSLSRPAGAGRSTASIPLRRELAGGWRLIVMEYLRPEDGWHAVSHAEFNEAMWQAVEAHFCSARAQQHSPSLVHGDLQTPLFAS